MGKARVGVATWGPLGLQFLARTMAGGKRASSLGRIKEDGRYIGSWELLGTVLLAADLLERGHLCLQL